MTSRHAAIDLEWGDGTHTFRLGLDELEELERKLDTSIFTLVDRLNPRNREAKVREISEIIRIGLIGGGKTPIDALALVRRYIDQRPLDESRDTAYAIGIAALMRVHSSETESPPGEAEAASSSASTSPPSTETQS